MKKIYSFCVGLLIFLVCFISAGFNFKEKQLQMSFEEKYPDINKIFNSHQRDLFIIKTNSKNLKGVYEKATDKQIIPPEYENLESFSGIFNNVFFYTNDNGIHKVLDYHNNIVFQAKYDKFNIKKWCGIETWKNNKAGMVTYSGFEILKPKYDEIECQTKKGVFDFYYIVKKGNKYAVFDNKGNVVIPFQKKKLKNAGYGSFISFEEKGKKGIMNINGSVIVEPVYSIVSYANLSLNNSNRFFVVCNYDEKAEFNELCGSIDETGEKHLPLIFMRDIFRISNEYYIARESNENSKAFIVDKNGNKMHKKGYNIIAPLNEKYFTVTDYDNTLKKNITSVIEINGKEILSPSNDYKISDTASENGLIKIEKAGKFGIAYNNKVIAKPVYKKIFFYRGYVLLLFEENNEKYYYVASIDDFAKNNGEFLKKYSFKQFTKMEDKNCFKFIKNDRTEDIFCSQ